MLVAWTILRVEFYPLIDGLSCIVCSKTLGTWGCITLDRLLSCRNLWLLIDDDDDDEGIC